MQLDMIIERLRSTSQHLADAAGAIEVADRDAGAGLTVAQNLGARREAEGLAELRTRLSVLADQIAADRRTVDECVTTTEDIKNGTGPRVAPLPSPYRSSAMGRRVDEPWWRGYANPLVLGLWAIVTVSWALWNRHSELWMPINALFVGAAISTALFGSRRPFRRRYYRVLWAMLAGAAGAPAVEYAIRGSLATGRLIGFGILAAQLAIIIVLYRRKRARGITVRAGALQQPGNHDG